MRPVHAKSIATLFIAGTLGLGAPAVAQDLTSLPNNHPEISVVSTAGETTTGVLRRFDASSVTLDVDGRDRVFQVPSIGRIYQRDPLKNGMLIGLASGLVIGAVAAVVECGDGRFSNGSNTCSGDELYFGFGLLGTIYGGLGLGIGAAIDALVHREKLLFRGAPDAPPVTLHVDRGAARLAFHVRW